MTEADFEAVCAREGIRVERRPYLYDEYLSRRPRPLIILNVGLTPAYRLFAGFHALGHWVWHPGDQEFYLGSPGWLHHTELEASTIGYLALAPAPAGPPFPRLERAYADAADMILHARHPLVLPGSRVTWRLRKTRLRRYLDQLEFEW